MVPIQSIPGPLLCQPGSRRHRREPWPEQVMVLDRARAAFDEHAKEWAAYTQTPLGRLREGLVIHHLARQLQGRPSGLRVLDVGSGTGGYALALAQTGHRVCLLDYSSEMLEVARESIAAASPDALDQIEFCCRSVEDLSDWLEGRRVDVILCHTVLEYTKHPFDVLETLVGGLCEGGLISLLLVNPSAETLRWALAKQDLGRALESLDQPVGRADMFGLPRRAIPLSDVHEALAKLGVSLVAEHGVRMFSDYSSTTELWEDESWSSLWDLEIAASEREPFRSIGRYTQIIGTLSDSCRDLDPFGSG